MDKINAAPTDKQLGLIARLSEQTGVEVPAPRTRKGASKLIERLLTVKQLAEVADVEIDIEAYATEGKGHEVVHETAAVVKRGDARGPSAAQLRLMEELGYSGEEPETIKDASKIIESLLEEARKTKEPTEKQLNYLDSLGYFGPAPASMHEAGQLIDRLR